MAEGRISSGAKVLRNKGKVSTATRKRVLQRAKELNYQTNWIARSLVTRRTFTIGRKPKLKRILITPKLVVRQSTQR